MTRWDRPSQHIANAIRWNAICTDPDWCEVGGTPVAFDSVAVIENPVVASPDVKAQDVPVYRVDDMHHGVKAVAGRSLGSGSANGSGFVKVLTGASAVFVNNKPVARNASAAQINCGPDGLGGVRGALLTEEKPPNPPPAPPQQTPPPSPAGQRTSPHLEELQRQEAALKAQLFDLEEYVRFRDVYPVVDQIQGTPGTWTDYAAQAGRGVLKAGLAVGDGVTTLANLALNASQRQSPAGMVLTTVQAQIAAENIRLGNTTLGSVGAAAGNMLLSVFVPPEAQTAWQRGDHLEAGVTTLGTLLTGGGLRRLFKDPPSPSNVPDNAGAAGRGLDEASDAGTAARNADEVAEEAAKTRADPAPSQAESPGVHIRAANAERAAHNAMVSKGFEPLGNTNGTYRPGQNGIDGVYRNPNPPPDYVITEAKYGSSQLNRSLADGTNQMDDAWVSARLDKAVGREQARLIREAMETGRASKFLIRLNEQGALTARLIDRSGYVVRGNAGKAPGF